jgi:hypothetical protein
VVVPEALEALEVGVGTADDDDDDDSSGDMTRSSTCIRPLFVLYSRVSIGPVQNGGWFRLHDICVYQLRVVNENCSVSD